MASRGAARSTGSGSSLLVRKTTTRPFIPIKHARPVSWSRPPASGRRTPSHNSRVAPETVDLTAFRETWREWPGDVEDFPTSIEGRADDATQGAEPERMTFEAQVTTVMGSGCWASAAARVAGFRLQWLGCSCHDFLFGSEYIVILEPQICSLARATRAHRLTHAQRTHSVYGRFWWQPALRRTSLQSSGVRWIGTALWRCPWSPARPR